MGQPEHSDRWKFAFKLLLGALLIGYVLRSKMVDFHSLQAVVLNPWNVVIGFVFLSFSMFCCALRWHLLVKAQGLSLSLKRIVELTMIGSFFNTFMPGAVGGDLIKAWYVAGQEPQRKTKAVFTVLLDRCIGLWVILLFAALTLLIYSSWLAQRTELKVLAFGVWAFSGGSLLFAILFFAFADKVSTRVHRMATRWKPLARIAQLIEYGLLYRNQFTLMAQALALSGASFLSSIIFYKLQGDSLGIPLETSRYFFIVPVAATISAIPLLPGGIGVGQVAFFTLFQWNGVAVPDQGGTLCTLVQIYTILFNCLGAFFYLKFKRHPAAGESTVLTAGKTSAAL